MNKYIYRLKAILLIAVIGIIHSAAYASNGINQNWDFKVYLDGDEIGFHNFSMIHKAQLHEIHSNAHFDVSFLFFNAYSYRHNNVERWNGKCLDSINAITDDNGKQYEVSGRAASDAFVVSTNKAISRYSACVKTFAYWSPEFLTETTLLNAQTGEMINVDSEFIGNETIKHKGKNVSAWHHRLHGDNLQIDLWYSVDDQWLALESLTESGRIIRYEMP